MRSTLLCIIACVLPLVAQAPSELAGSDRAASDLSVGVNKSMVLENPSAVRRVLVGNPEIAEAVVVSPNEVVVNGKTPGDTTLVLWTVNGQRNLIDVHVLPGHSRSTAIAEELARELPGQDVNARIEEGSVFLHGTVNDLVSANRAEAIAGTAGKVVNLLRVKVPPAEPQILLKVRFANVDRGASLDLGANFISTGAGNTPGAISTGAFSPPATGTVASPASFTISDALNIFLYRPDLDFGATIKALQSKQLLEILAEPNLLTLSGKPASFLAGGEFPYPTLQGGGGGVGQITVQFREFGVRIHFLPSVTPRGTIRMTVIPEVSSLDFANGLVVQGFTVPGLATRRVETEIELANGQSFIIAGLLDNRLNETISKIPGLGDIPLLGKMFQSTTRTRNRSELLVMVTPEIVEPLPAGAPHPEIPMPKAFLNGSMIPPSNPVAPASDAVSRARRETLPVELLRSDAEIPPAPTSPQSPAQSPTPPAPAPK